MGKRKNCVREREAGIAENKAQVGYLIMCRFLLHCRLSEKPSLTIADTVPSLLFLVLLPCCIILKVLKIF